MTFRATTILGEPLPPGRTKELQEEVAELLGRTNKGFPGSQPVTLQRKHFIYLEESDYFLYEKSDGVRCLLFLSMRVDPTGRVWHEQYFIDRKNKYYRVQSDLSLSANGCGLNWSNGTLVDGELVIQALPGGEHQRAFIMFDCLAVGGNSILDWPFKNRRRQLKRSVWRTWQACIVSNSGERRADQAPSMSLEFKQSLPAYRVRRMLKEIIPDLAHTNDGLIFVKAEAPYTCGTDHTTFKWKPPGHNTVDFRLETGVEDQGQPELRLAAHVGSGKHQTYALLHPPLNIEEAGKLVALAATHPIIECALDASGTWQLKLDEDGNPKIRKDKLYANHMTVVGEILQSIQDNIDIPELISESVVVRQGWKARALGSGR